tara:strand:+ start:249 stop:2636 length:2388 start_codon:yes stop_codon:yes gene_type:complete
MTIKLNEFDRKLLSSIKPSDTWNKLKNIYTINGEVKRLKIGNKKIGRKCAIHLKKLSNKSEVTLNEIKDGCKDLIPKKHKHGLVKDKTKKDKETQHTKLDVGQDKPEKSKVKKPAKPRQPSATQQLVNLLTTQQRMQTQQTIQTQIQQVDKILTDRNQNVELPKQTPQLQLTRQPLGSQVQDNSANLRMRLLEGSLLDKERGLAEIASNLDNQKQLLKERLRNPSLLQRQPRLQLRTETLGQSPMNRPPLPLGPPPSLQGQTQLSAPLSSRSDTSSDLDDISPIDAAYYDINSIDRERINLKSKYISGSITSANAVNRLRNVKNTLNSSNLLDIIPQQQAPLRDRVSTVSRNLDSDIDYYMNEIENQDKSGAFRSLTSNLVNREKNQQQKQLLKDLTTLGKMERQKQIEDTLGNLQSGVMQRVSGIGEQQNIFDRNTRLNLEKSESLGDLQEQELELGRSGSFSARLPETKSYEELQEDFYIAQRKRDRLLRKPRISNRQKRKQQKAQEILELQQQEKQTSDLVDRLILDTEETNKDVDKFKKEMGQEEVAMEEDKPPIKMMSPDDVIGMPKSRYVIQSGLGTPSQVYGNPDSSFYNKNYKDILNKYVIESRNTPIYNEPMRNNYAQTWDIINKIKNAKIYTAESKTKDLRHRKDYQKDLLKQLHARNVEQLMDRYLLEQNPQQKEYFKYAGIAAEQYFKSQNPNEDPQYKLFNKISKRGKGVSISPEKFIKELKLLDVDDVDSKKWDREAERLKEFHQEWDEEMSESAKRSYMAGSSDMFSAGLGKEGFNELPY